MFNWRNGVRLQNGIILMQLERSKLLWHRGSSWKRHLSKWTAGPERMLGWECFSFWKHRGHTLWETVSSFPPTSFIIYPSHTEMREEGKEKKRTEIAGKNLEVAVEKVLRSAVLCLEQRSSPPPSLPPKSSVLQKTPSFQINKRNPHDWSPSSISSSWTHSSGHAEKRISKYTDI